MKILTAAFALVAVAACANAPARPVFEGDPYGEKLTLTEVTPVSAILETPSAYVGKKVLIEGEVVAVCEKKGCWMDLETEGRDEIQVKVEDDVIIFPLTAKGRTALVEGVVEERNLTAEQAFAAAAHRAEEQGEKFDSTAVYPATKAYRILGTGALIRDTPATAGE